MRLQRNPTGDFFVDPAILAQRLGLSVAELQRRMRIGLVTSMVEAGSGDDEGRNRLTVRCGQSAWRAIVDENDLVVSEETYGRGGAVPAEARAFPAKV